MSLSSYSSTQTTFPLVSFQPGSQVEISMFTADNSDDTWLLLILSKPRQEKEFGGEGDYYVWLNSYRQKNQRLMKNKMKITAQEGCSKLVFLAEQLGLIKSIFVITPKPGAKNVIADEHWPSSIHFLLFCK